MSSKLPTKKQIDAALQKNVWHFGNSILYKLCKDNFEHKADDKIVTKVLFIGRIYAAAVERRKNKSSDGNDKFYTKTVAPAFRNPKLDQKLVELKRIKTLKAEDIYSVLKAHHYLTNMLHKITALEKRSFSSKYLHFHFPELFYIYDSRAVSGLREFSHNVPLDLKHLPELKGVDKEYAKFYCKCFDLKKQINIKYNIKLTNRQLDNVLIEVANKKSGKF